MIARSLGSSLTVLLGALALACSVDPAHDARTCTVDSDCAAGLGCDRGFCIRRDAGGTDADVTDAGPPDAGSCLPIQETCVVSGAAGSCAAGQVYDCEGTTVCRSLVEPGEEAEVCNTEDDDCDGDVDETTDFNDPATCGSCGGTCATGLNCCDGSCTNLLGDELNCGGCGTSCEDMGFDVPRCCGVEGCVDLASDDQNCGACGNECDAITEECCGGRCVNTDTSIVNCGVCGEICDGVGEVCCRGACSATCTEICTPSCASTEACCGGTCIDVDSNADACGSCTNRCADGELCCARGCVANDELNCGACGHECGSGEICCDNACIPQTATNCGECGSVCGGGETCCDGECSNRLSDEANCGTCGTACSGTRPECNGGGCCETGRTWCPLQSACRNLMGSDNGNCGECGRGCPALYGCRSGSCVFLGL